MLHPRSVKVPHRRYRFDRTGGLGSATRAARRAQHDAGIAQPHPHQMNPDTEPLSDRVQRQLLLDIQGTQLLGRGRAIGVDAPCGRLRGDAVGLVAPAWCSHRRTVGGLTFSVAASCGTV